MLVGLKRDLRREGEEIIYPQEVSCFLTVWLRSIFLISISGTNTYNGSLIGLHKSSAVTDMQNVRLSLGSFWLRLLRIWLGLQV